MNYPYKFILIPNFHVSISEYTPRMVKIDSGNAVNNSNPNVFIATTGGIGGKNLHADQK